VASSTRTLHTLFGTFCCVNISRKNAPRSIGIAASFAVECVPFKGAVLVVAAGEGDGRAAIPGCMVAATMSPTTIEITATVLFATAVLHTFATSRFMHIAHRFREGSVGENLFHLLGEVEVVFGFWAGVLIAVIAVLQGGTHAVAYAENLHFTEPAFVVVIMTVAATRPILQLASRIMVSAARLVPLHREAAIYASCLVLGPLLGSFITEPAAMTVTALLLKQRYYDRGVSSRLMYGTVAVLFVNVSIGGVLTPYAAPPVLMVAGRWNWDVAFMLQTFGWKAALACAINAAAATAIFYRELAVLPQSAGNASEERVPAWVTVLHLLFVLLIVVTAHHSVIFIGVFLFFLGIATITKEYQDELRLRQSLLVGFFLAGLVVLGGLQSWWLQPLLARLDAFPLFAGTTALTAITDNAALTYLGSQVEGISEAFKYALVAGAVAGGGLTVIANAPNPAGYSILNERFGPDGIKPLYLFLFALPPTLVAVCCLWLLP